MAAAIVFFYSYFRFNTPPTARSSTTFRRFHTAATLYALGAVVMWAFVTLLPPDVATKLIGKWPADLRGLGWPFATALVFSALLPSFPGIQAFDARVRSTFHNFARVTEEAEALATRLRRIALRQDAYLEAQVTAAFRVNELNPSDVAFYANRDARSVWTRITVLKLKVDAWDERGISRGFFEVHRAEIRAARLSYEALIPTARRRLALLRRLRTERGDARLDSILNALVEEIRGISSSERSEGVVLPMPLRRKIELLSRVDDSSRTLNDRVQDIVQDIDTELVEQLEKLEDQLLAIVARATLHRGRSEATRKSRLIEAGFNPADGCRDPFFDWVTLLALAVLLFYPFVLTFTPSVASRTAAERLLTGALVAVVYIAAIMAAIYSKRWSLSHRDASRPFRAYTLAGVAAAGTWGAVFLTLWMVKSGSAAAARSILFERWPWILMAFMTAFSTAWTLDDRGSRFARFKEAIGQSTALASVAVAVVILLRQVSPNEGALPLLNARHVGIVVTSAITGAVLGATLPTWWRRWRVTPEQGAVTVVSPGQAVMETTEAGTPHARRRAG